MNKNKNNMILILINTKYYTITCRLIRAEKSFNALKVDLTNHFDQSLRLGFEVNPTMVKQWGVRISYNDSDEKSLSISFHSQDTWINRISNTIESAEQLLPELHALPPSAAGAQLLRLFFIDMLGTDTPEAKIFVNKSGSFFNDVKVSIVR